MEETPWWLSLIIAWAPFLLFIGSTLWVGKRIGRELTTPNGRSIAELVEENAQELKRSNDLLSLTVADLRARIEALERR